MNNETRAKARKSQKAKVGARVEWK